MNGTSISPMEMNLYELCPNAKFDTNCLVHGAMQLTWNSNRLISLEASISPCSQSKNKLR